MTISRPLIHSIFQKNYVEGLSILKSNFKIRSFVNNKKAQLREIHISVTSDSPPHLPKSDAQETIVEEESIQTPKKQISFRGIMSLLKNTNLSMRLK